MKKIFTLFAALVCVMSMSAVTYNVTVPAGTKACYIAGEMNEWKHQEMTKVDETHYTITIAEATTAMGYKYCSGPGWAYVEKDASGNEIGDRAYSAEDVVAKWAAVYEPSATPEEPKEEKDITVKAKVPATWTNTITAWVWPTGGAGKEVTPAKEGEWYVYTEKCSELNIIFKNGTGWNGDINQTVDITISESTCVEITAGTGKATYTIVDCEDNPGEEPGDDPVVTPDPETGVTYNVTVPAGTKACYIAGEMNEWKHQEMTKVDETHYTITIATATATMKYKYCSGPDWAYVEMQADGVTDVQDRTYAANDVVEAWKAVYDPAGENPGEEPGDDPVVDPETGVTYNVAVPAGTKACYIAGEMNEWKHQEMTKVDETHYTITIATATATMKYKYCSGPDWAYVEMQADGVTDVQDRTYAANDVVEAWKAVYDPAGENPGEDPGDDPVVDPETGVTYNVTVPAGTKACYIAGEMNEWKHQEMTKVDETHYTITIATATATMKYKYCSGPDWAYVEMQADGVTDVQDRTYAANDVVEAWKAVYEPAGEDPTPGEPKDITVKAKAPAAWTEQITAWVWATGGEGQEVVPTQEGEWYVYTQNCAELNIIFKNGAGWNGDANQTVDITVTESTCIEITADGATKATYTVVDCEGGEVIDPAQITYVLMGVQGDWTTGIELTKNEIAEWEEYMLLGQTISQGDSVKVVRLEAGVAKHWCGNVKEGVTVTITYDDNGNIILAPGTYDFYYDVAADAIWIAEAAQTAVDNVILENKATKIIRNGQMYIIREGVMYNALGQVAE